MTSYFLPQKREPRQVPEFVKKLPNQGTGKLALFDADGTLWVDDVNDDFTKYAIDQGIISGDLWEEYLKIYAADPPTGCVFALKFFKGLKINQLNDSVEHWWLNLSRRKWITEVIESIFLLSDRGYSIWLVTGTPTELLLPVKKFLPVHEVLGMDYEVDTDKRITGNLSGILCAADGKAEKVLSLWEKPEDILFSVGNSSMDAPMMELASHLKWCVYPNDQFLKESTEKKWKITPRPEDFVEEAKFLNSE